MSEVHTVTEAAPTSTGVRFFVGVITDTPAVALEWAAKLEEMISEATPDGDISLPDVNPTVKKIILAALDDGADLDRDRYDAMFRVLVEVSSAGREQRISMADLAGQLGLQTGTIRAMNTKLSIRIGRVLEKRADELENAPPNQRFPLLQRNIDALLDTKWDKGNPSYRLTPSALPAIQEWLANRA